MAVADDDFERFAKAVKKGELALVRGLLQSGCPADVPNRHGWTALMLAASSGQTPIAECLLAHGADVNATNDFGASALAYAALSGECRVIALLLRAGATVKVRPHGVSLIQFARWGGGMNRTNRHLQLLSEAGAA